MFGGAGLGAPLRCKLAQPMRAKLLEPRLATPVLEPITKAFDRVRLPISRYEIDEVSEVLLRGVDALPKWRQDRQLVGFDLLPATFFFGEYQLLHGNGRALGRSLGEPPLHLRAQLDDVAAPHPGIEQQVKRQPRLCADRMARFVARRIVFGPCPDPVGIGAAQDPDIARRVRLGEVYLVRTRPGE